MTRKFDDYLNERLKDDNFKEEYDKLDNEYSFAIALIEARNKKKLSQKQLAEKTGMTQADISKIESGNRNLSIRTLQRLADGLDMDLKIQFVSRK
ncbi:helix-turn-helix transcriptional regulator [uncultured Traorella sp.]|uniref:helix-turn-helix domain-containing protein n=1 Tax=uncultured Traorella sp. TaxID=1929048 RepID=UPI0025FFB868|nr:helix-turn-helix transcriptional regulator [uncultured Traorella sp.]